MSDTLHTLRDAIQVLDEEIVRLLNERAELSVQVGGYKKKQGLDVHDPRRERELVSYLEGVNKGPISASSLRQIYREILSVSRSLQKPATAAYLGPEASFTHLAARSRFGGDAVFSAQPTVFDVFEEVEKRRADFGVVPAENSLEGSVKQTLDKLISTPLSIVGDVYLPISHCLLSIGGEMKTVKKIYSHPQALAQCQRWLRNNLPRCELHEEESTAKAARRVMNDEEAAAVGSKAAALTYGLAVTAEGIEDHPLNVTRFLVLGEGISAATGRDKTSIVFGVRHEPGALLRSLNPFSDKGINLTKIVSHPTKERIWEYLFFVDFTGHADDEKVAACMEKLREACTFVKVLGSYPMGEQQS